MRSTQTKVIKGAHWAFFHIKVLALIQGADP